MMKKILMLCVLMVLPLQLALAGFSMPKMPDTSKFSSKFKMPQAGGGAAKNMPKGVNFSKPSKAPVKPTYIPHVYLGGAGGFMNWTVLGQADVFLPVLTRYDRVVYVYGQGRYSHDNNSWAKNPWTGSLGAGYRQIFSHEIIVGAYALGDYCNTSLGHKIMEASPGIEALTQNWDFRINGYIPFGTKDWVHSYWASDLGDYTYVMPIKHNVFDARYVFHSQTGYGADAEVGRKICNIYHMPIKAFINGYYYSMPAVKKDVKDAKGTVYTPKEIGKNSNIYGVGARVTLDANTFLRFYASYAYDNHKSNSIMVGLRLSVNDIFNNRSRLDSDIDLQNRLFEPIERNFASIDNASTARETGGPDDKLSQPYIDTPTQTKDYEKYQDVWYWDASKTAVNDQRIKGDPGTVENPFTAADFTVDKLNEVAAYAKSQGFPGARLDFATGNYSTISTLVFPNDCTFSIQGYESKFKRPASGINRPIFTGEFYIPKGKDIADIQLIDPGFSTSAACITIASGNDVNISDVTLKNSDNRDETTIGISVANAQNVNVNDVNISSADYMTGDIGLDVENITGNVNIYNVTIGRKGFIDYLIGIRLKDVATSDGAEINIKNPTVFVGANNNNEDPIGIDCLHSEHLKNGKLTITEASDKSPGINVNTSGASDSNNAYGIKTMDGAMLNLNNTNVTVNTDNGGANSANAWGVSIGDDCILNVDGGDINVEAGRTTTAGANSDNVYGIQAHGKNDIITLGNDKAAHINVQTQGTGKHSANSYGILVGDSQYAVGADGDITGNRITVENDSTVNSTGKSSGTGCYSGNGYGILVGYGYSNDSKVITGNIENNQIYVYGSGKVPSNDDPDTVSGTGYYDTPVGDTEGLHSGNGYGILVGYDYGEFSKGTTSAYIKNDHIECNGAKITGTGTNDRSNYTISNDGYIYGGNGFGVMLGYGAVKIDDKNNSINLDILSNKDDNKLSIVNSTVTGQGTLKQKMDSESKKQFSDLYAGRGFGVLVGFGSEFIGDFRPKASLIEQNEVYIDGSTLNTTSSNDAKIPSITVHDLYAREYLESPNTGYGLLMGIAGRSGGEVSNSYTRYDTLDMNNSFVNLTCENSGKVSVVGVAVGNYYTSSHSVDCNNTIDVKGTTFNAINSDKAIGDAYMVGLFAPYYSTDSWHVDLKDSEGKSYFTRDKMTPKKEIGYGVLGSKVGEEEGHYIQWYPATNSFSSYTSLLIPQNIKAMFLREKDNVFNRGEL